MTDRMGSERPAWAGEAASPGEYGYADFDDPSDEDGDEQDGGRGISPGVVFLAIALIGSVAFALYAVTVRDASQIPLLAAGAAVLGIVFAVLALFSIRATWRAGIDARNGQALVLGIGGGISAIIAAGCLAGAIILFLLSQG